VLVDALAAFNAGPDAVRDLERALEGILDCFRVGQRTFFSTMVRPRIDKILFAATKADHMHHTSHDRLEAILSRMTKRAAERARFAGTAIDVVALAAVRATREATVKRGRETLPSILGVPAAGEVAGGETFDGRGETAIFPGDLPTDADTLFSESGDFRGLTAGEARDADFRFLRFRPPAVEIAEDGTPGLPHIRLDRALQFLIGDRLK
jgi:predicted YcjX-like family ATPase